MGFLSGQTDAKCPMLFVKMTQTGFFSLSLKRHTSLRYSITGIPESARRARRLFYLSSDMDNIGKSGEKEAEHNYYNIS